jgi:NADH-quinone oxidoreductase subunit E
MAVRRLAPAELQPGSFAFTEANQRWLEKQVAKYPDGRQASAVIPALWQAQKQHDGWLPQRAIESVAATLGMPLIRVMEVATFYTMFNLEPVGRYFIQLCGTVPCHVKGAIDLKQVLLDRVGDQHHVTQDGYFSWLEVECLGACCNAPMVQINDDYYEDLTPDLLIKLLDDLKAGRAVKPGPQNGRVSSEPLEAVHTLTDPALYDGSVVGAWRERFKDELSGAPSVGATGEHGAATATGPGDPKAAKPDAGRATERQVADTPASRAADGKEPVKPADQAAASRTDSTGAVHPGPKTATTEPRSDKSYTMTPSKPEEGRVAADQKGGTTPVAGTPTAERTDRRDGSDTKPVGASPDVSPGVPPKE